MNRKIIGIFVATAMVLGLSLSACEQEPEDRFTVREGEQAMTAIPEQREVEIDSEQSELYVPERVPEGATAINRHFIAAKSYYQQGRFELSANEIIQAAKLIENTAGRADTDEKRELKTRAFELRTLAAEVKNNNLADVDIMDDTFYRTYYTLADYHMEMANQYWTREMVQETAENMEQAGDYLEDAAIWADNKVDAALAATLNAARRATRKIRSGARWTADEVGDALRGMGRDIQQFGQRVEPKNQPAGARR